MFICNTIPSIIAFIFVLLPSKPAGVRFDRNPNDAGMQSMPASPALTQQSQYPAPAAPQSQYPAQQQQYAGMQDNMTNNYAVNAGSVSNNSNHSQYLVVV